MKNLRLPRSWPLWLSWLGLMGALLAEHMARLSPLGHEALELAVVAGFFAALAHLVNGL